MMKCTIHVCTSQSCQMNKNQKDAVVCVDIPAYDEIENIDKFCCTTNDHKADFIINKLDK